MHFYFEDLTNEDLEKILEKRCQLPLSRAKLLVKIMKDLQVMRSSQNIFAGKESVITIRDLLKWGAREIDSKEDLALQGYCLLAERLRNSGEREWLSAVISKLTGIEKINANEFYVAFCNASIDRYKKNLYDKMSLDDWNFSLETNLKMVQEISFSDSFARMWTLVELSLNQKEPVLLIGETGCGKTTVAQAYAELRGLEFYSVNCHQHTESSDFIGSLRPVRGKQNVKVEIEVDLLQKFLGIFNESGLVQSNREFTEIFVQKTNDGPLEIQENSYGPQNLENGCLMPILEGIKTDWPILTDANGTFASKKQFLLDVHTKVEKYLEVEENLNSQKVKTQLTDLLQKIFESLEKLEKIFEWTEGPLIKCMKYGGVILIDEISLAQDSVLERLNSILETDRKILLSEKGDSSSEEIVAHQNCYIIATMNPSGDFGKKELTPALRNRFTEIWVEPPTNPAKIQESPIFTALKSLKTFKELETLKTQNNDLLDLLHEIIDKSTLKSEAQILTFFDSKIFVAKGPNSQEMTFGEIKLFLAYAFYMIVSEFNVNFSQE
jgi:midasin